MPGRREDAALLESVASAKGETIGGSAPEVTEAETVAEDESLVGAVAAAAEEVAAGK